MTTDPVDPEPAETDEVETVTDRLRMPLSRAGVLDLLARFQSSIASGQPPLDELLTKSASLTTPSAEVRRGAPSRTVIAGALGSSFVDPRLIYDPLDVAVRASKKGAEASVPLEAASGGAPRRIVLSLELGYHDGQLRIQDIALVRSP